MNSPDTIAEQRGSGTAHMPTCVDIKTSVVPVKSGCQQFVLVEIAYLSLKTSALTLTTVCEAHDDHSVAT
ncbi:hypothetical protein [Rhodoferax fermentans]|uniref:hypothetical protein n=1 Tax=Rhodoferax fermentans TaxID=28066 RepID=UPI00117BAC14|nr:hypothetical protein [Rhodoferax fermentans]